MNHGPKPLMKRIEALIRDSKPSRITGRQSLSDEEIAEKAVSLLEEILGLMNAGAIVKSNKYKDIVL